MARHGHDCSPAQVTHSSLKAGKVSGQVPAQSSSQLFFTQWPDPGLSCSGASEPMVSMVMGSGGAGEEVHGQ